MRQRLAFTIALFWALLGLAAPPAVAQSVLRDDFEGPEASLRDAGGDASYKIDGPQRISQGAHSGRSCERLTVRGNNGTYVYVSHPLLTARVISELVPSIWLKADRPGLQLLARVTLPRSIDPRNGKPLVTLVRGSAYSQVGSWQQLRVDNLPQSLERQVRVLRTQFGRDVDAREAYVDRILINVYGGPGVTNVWVDDFEIAGAVSPQAAGPAVAASATLSGPILSTPDISTAWPGGASVPAVDRSGPLLLVGGKPFFPRIIEYQGEPLARLLALGFNAVRMPRTPNVEFMREAAGLGMWVIAPPPPAAELEARSTGSSATKIGSPFDPVLVWDLGSGLATRELAATRQWAKLVQAADPRGRPMACDAESDLQAYTRPPVNLLFARRDVLGTTLQLTDYVTWLRERSQLVLPGTPLWVTVQTEPMPRLAEQLTLLSGGQAPPLGLQESQVRMLIRAALAGGARGLCFASRSRLDADDLATRHRAAVLELMNLELDLIDRWPASGNFTAGARSSDPHASGPVIETDRSRLLMPIYAPPNSQLVMGASVVKMLSFRVQGVPEGYDAYELSPVSFRPLKGLREAGGTRVILDDQERDSLVVFTQDALVIGTLKSRIAKMQQRAVQLTRELAAGELSLVEAAEQRLVEVGRAIPATRTLRATAQTDMRQCEALLAKNDAPGAFYKARHALSTLRLIERAHWENAMPASQWPLSDPWTASFATLSEHYRFAAELASDARGPNRLPFGDFEDLQAMGRAGWIHYQHEERRSPQAAQSSIATAVDLTPAAAHSGRTGLRLRAVASDPKSPPPVVETPSLWVTSPAVHVEGGQLLQIQAWVRVAAPIVGSVDGLLVIDTLSGEALAQRVAADVNWRQITLYRVAPRAGSMAITLALSGLGEAWIDDVTIQVVERGRAGPAQQAQQAGAPRFAPAPDRPALLRSFLGRLLLVVVPAVGIVRAAQRLPQAAVVVGPHQRRPILLLPGSNRVAHL